MQTAVRELWLRGSGNVDWYIVSGHGLAHAFPNKLSPAIHSLH